MPHSLFDQSFPRLEKEIHPISLAKRNLRKALLRRFYKEARAQLRGGAYVLLLDGREAKSPRGNTLALPTLAAAQALAAEWSGQRKYIDPSAMPLTRIVNSAIDGVACQVDATVDEIARYARSDLVCYRAAEPRALAEAQATAWDKVLAFAREKPGAVFSCTEGVMFVEQPDAACIAVKDAIRRIASTGKTAPFALAALHIMTTLTGSVLIAFAMAHGELTPAEAWSGAHVDEDFEMRAWGEDAEALQRRGLQWREMEAAACLFQAVRGAGR